MKITQEEIKIGVKKNLKGALVYTPVLYGDVRAVDLGRLTKKCKPIPT